MGGKTVNTTQAAADSNFYEAVIAAYNFKQKNYLQVREAIGKAAGAGLGDAFDGLILVLTILGWESVH